MKNLILSSVIAFISTVSFAQPPAIQWQKSYGGTDVDIAHQIQKTSDGGYIIAGESKSNDSNVSGNHGDIDFWIVKINYKGDLQWQKSLGGSNTDIATSIQQTNDGGYIVAGYSNSNDGDVSGNHGLMDVWVVKLDDTGRIIWQKSFGGSGVDMANSIWKTFDGGYIVAGGSGSKDGDVTGNHRGLDVWVVKLNDTGGIQWEKSFGGSGYDIANSVQQTFDSGYIVAGYSNSKDGDVTGNHGAADVWVAKLNDTGKILRKNSFGGSKNDEAASIQQTSDGGYIVGGWSESNDKDVRWAAPNDSNVTSNHGSEDFWIVKLDAILGKQWQKSLGGKGIDNAGSIQQTTDGGYIVAGNSSSNDGDVTGHHTGNGLYDYWVVKLSESGVIQWQKSLGGSNDDIANSILQTSDGGYIVAGSSESNDGDATWNYGMEDFWVVKLGCEIKAITGDSSVCMGGYIYLTDSMTGGIWSSDSLFIAWVDSITGIVHGVNAGTAVISYTLPTGCRTTITITVNPSATVNAGPDQTICAGGTAALAGSFGGCATSATWSASSGTFSNLYSTTSTYTPGYISSITTIMLTLTAKSCPPCGAVTDSVRITVIPGATAYAFAPQTICSDTLVTLTGSIGGVATSGTWSSTTGGTFSYPTYYAWSTYSPSATDISAGSVTLTLTTNDPPGPCGPATSSVVIRVTPKPEISGSSSVCVGAATTLNVTPPNGSWSSSNTTIATVSSAGVVTGVGTGMVAIYYSSGGCYAYKLVTLNASPAAITGIDSVCIGSMTILSDYTSGGTWSSSNIWMATVGTTGLVTGVGTGTPTITYTLSTGCFNTTTVNVNPAPAAIVGTAVICVGSTTTLTDATTGGTWYRSNITTTINPSSGALTGLSVGNNTITYSLPDGCFVTTAIKVNPSDSASIIGPNHLCVGSTITLTDCLGPGTWYSGTPSVASIGSANGIVTGVSTGGSLITYTRYTDGINAFMPIIVNPLPANITGPSSVGLGLTTTLADGTPGGTWSSSNTGIATVNSAGVVTGRSVGSVTIFYTLSTGCAVATTVTVASP